MTQANFQPESNSQVLQMLSAINDKISSMDNKIKRMSEEITTIKVAQAETNGKIDTVGAKIVSLEEKFDQRFETVEVRIGSLDKRIDNQEFVNRGIFVGLILVVISGAAKLVFG